MTDFILTLWIILLIVYFFQGIFKLIILLNIRLFVDLFKKCSLLFSTLIEKYFFCKTNDYEYSTYGELTEDVMVPKYKFVSKTKPKFETVINKIPVNKTRKVPRYRSVTKVRQVPKYKTVRKTRPKYKNVEEEYTECVKVYPPPQYVNKLVWKNENYIDYEHYTEQVPHTSYHGGHHRTTFSTVHKTRQVPKCRPIYIMDRVLEPSEPKYENVKKTRTKKIQDGYESYDDKDVDHYSDEEYNDNQLDHYSDEEYVDYIEELQQKSIGDETYEEKIPDGYETIKETTKYYSTTNSCVSICLFIIFFIFDILFIMTLIAVAICVPIHLMNSFGGFSSMLILDKIIFITSILGAGWQVVMLIINIVVSMIFLKLAVCTI